LIDMANNRSIDNAPAELQDAIREFFPPDQWDNAAAVAYLESGWSAFATRDTRTAQAPCGARIGSLRGVPVSSEYSIGWYQINACNLPSDWTPAHLYNTRHNVGTAHEMFSRRGWQPWYFSARTLGLI
jgi:hypothetical protein